MYFLGFEFNWKHAVRHIISCRENEILLVEEVYRSSVCPVVLDKADGSNICKHCTACIRMNNNLQRSREAYVQKTQMHPLSRLTANASKSRLEQTVKLQNKE